MSILYMTQTEKNYFYVIRSERMKQNMRISFIITSVMLLYNLGLFAAATPTQLTNLLEVCQQAFSKSGGANAGPLLPLSTTIATMPAGQTAIIARSGQTLQQFWFSPTFGNAGFSELEVVGSDLALMNKVLASGHALTIVFDIVNSTTGAGFDLVYKMYDVTTQFLVCNNKFSSITANNAIIPQTAVWASMNFTYQMSNDRVSMLSGISAAHPQAIQIGNKTGAAKKPASYPPATQTLPTLITIPTGAKFQQLAFSPNFTNGITGSTCTECYITTENFAQLPSNGSVLFVGELSVNGTGGYDYIVTAYNPSNQQPYFSQQFENLVWYVNGFAPTNASTTQITTNSQLTGTYVGYSFLLQSNSATPLAWVNLAHQTAINFVGAVAALPYPQSSQIFSTPVTIPAQSTLAQLTFSPNFSNGITGSTCTECYISAANLALIPSGTSVLFVGKLISVGNNYTYTITAYNPSTQQAYFTQQFQNLVWYVGGYGQSNASTTVITTNSQLTGMYVGYSFLPQSGSETAITWTNIGTQSAINFAPSTAPTLPFNTTPVTIPAAQQSMIVPSGQSMLQLWFSPVFNNGNFAEMSVDAADLASMNQVFAQGHNLQIVFDVVNSATGSGFDLVYKMYDTTTQSVVCSNTFSSITYNGVVIPQTATWTGINFTYQVSTMTGTDMLANIPAAHPQALQI